jgi:hypothetical protein
VSDKNLMTIREFAQHLKPLLSPHLGAQTHRAATKALVAFTQTLVQLQGGDLYKKMLQAYDALAELTNSDRAHDLLMHEGVYIQDIQDAVHEDAQRDILNDTIDALERERRS